MHDLRVALEALSAQRQAQVDGLRRQLSSAEVPLSAGIVQQLASMNPRDLREILVNHPGYESWEALQSYEASLNVFHKAFADLLLAIDRFVTLAREDRILGRTNEAVFREVETQVQKELFAATNAAHSLVDHSTRQLQGHLKVPGYVESISECFGDDGLHDFVIGLRTILHHVHIHRPAWTVRRDVANRELYVACQLDRDAIALHADKLNSLSRSYLERSPPKIDAREVFTEYHRRASAFHTWFSHATNAESLHPLRDYERCLRENNRMATRTLWKAMIGNWLNWSTPPNPYEHLDRYLTGAEREIVDALPKRSREQVDRIIALVDRHSACDDELRGLVYKLFETA